MAGTIDNAVEKKRDQKQADAGGQGKVEQSAGPGEGDSSANKNDAPRKQARPQSETDV
jgi:hypothetical protein